MATDQEKIANRARMWGLTVMGMSAGIWEMVENLPFLFRPSSAKTS